MSGMVFWLRFVHSRAPSARRIANFADGNPRNIRKTRRMQQRTGNLETYAETFLV